MHHPTESPPARLLDLTRSLRRVGRMATGVDRVEQAYLRALLDDPVPVFGLLRTPFGYLLLDPEGMERFARHLQGASEWGPADLLSRLPRRRDDILRRAESTARHLASARCLPRRLPRLLKAQLPEGFAYLNIGHSNLTERVLSAVTAAGGRSSVFIHDTIPLDHPQFQRPGSVAPFEAKLRRVGKHAATVIYNSHDTRSRCEARLAVWARVPPGVVAHLGVERPQPDPALLARLLPPGTLPDAPYFVMLGTIEPRKNHKMILDIWDRLGPEAPGLVICGARGWNNEEVFARLDALPPDGPLREIAGLPDAAVAALVAGAAGLLFPSFAEGFGLPPVEARMLGTPVFCSDLAVLREVMGNKAVYAPPADGYLWEETIRNWAKDQPKTHQMDPFDGPAWADHFKIVLRVT